MDIYRDVNFTDSAKIITDKLSEVSMILYRAFALQSVV